MVLVNTRLQYASVHNLCGFPNTQDEHVVSEARALSVLFLPMYFWGKFSEDIHSGGSRQDKNNKIQMLLTKFLKTGKAWPQDVRQQTNVFSERLGWEAAFGTAIPKTAAK